MKSYKIKIDPEALADIQELAHWYESVQTGLGKRFVKITVGQINSLSRNPQMYAIRYHEIRCMIVRKFPCMVHFYIHTEQKVVEVLAAISTYRNPELWIEKTEKRK